MGTPVGHGMDVLGWHLASALCMGAMVAATLPPALALVGIGLFVGGARLVRSAAGATDLPGGLPSARRVLCGDGRHAGARPRPLLSVAMAAMLVGLI